jgi:chromosome segregation ATPase
VGRTPDPKTAQIERLKADIDKLNGRLAKANSTIEQLSDFRTQALAQLAVQHEEILRLRVAAARNANVTRLPAARQKVIGPC